MADDAPWQTAGAPDAVGTMAAQLAASAVSPPRKKPPQKKRDADEDAKRDRSKRLGEGADGRGVFKATPPKQPLLEARLVTPPNENVARSLGAAPEQRPAWLELLRERRVAQRKAQLREKEEADRKARYEEAELTYFEVPPLPEGATDADLERLEDEDLEAMYGR